MDWLSEPDPSFSHKILSIKLVLQRDETPQIVLEISLFTKKYHLVLGLLLGLFFFDCAIKKQS